MFSRMANDNAIDIDICQIALIDIDIYFQYFVDIALFCHDLPFQRLPLTATDWLKCLNAQKLLVD